MVQATNFLLRWLFLCRLVDDRAEVQTWPYRPPGYFENRHSHAHQGHSHAVPPPPPPHPTESERDSTLYDDGMDMPMYRESVIRSLTSHPPGSTERLQKLDELRLQTVRDFARRLANADQLVRYSVLTGDSATDAHGDAPDQTPTLDDDLDADEFIHSDLRAFLQKEHQQDRGNNLWHRWNAVNAGVDHGTHDNLPTEDLLESIKIKHHSNNPFVKDKSHQQIQNEISSAHHLLSETRSFLPQLVSTVLHSPPALLPGNTVDPISSLRSLLIRRCQADPSLGIELCWLLEAEVGRKWKALFEHRQQTGKRLILIVQADIAQAIATIGAEKASAFNLLQDAEMATAFGMERTYENKDGGGVANGIPGYRVASTEGTSPRLPKSISDLRCRHFGDSMHFVDRLSQISLDLRRVPPAHRRTHLQERLREMNERLCRRMVTRGRISIDVESSNSQDGQFGYHSSYHHHSHPMPQWSEDNIREDMIQHSVHFPMEPQSVRWPGGSGDGDNSALSDFERPQQRNGVVRALRILLDKCRVLDSRERCPFLVRMEVVETGLDANDARLYAMDAAGVGLTVEEALGTTRPHRNSILGNGANIESGFASCAVPPELMRSRICQAKKEECLSPLSDSAWGHDRVFDSQEKKAVPRGGYQGPDESYYAPPMYGDYNTFELVRDHHYEQLHQELRQHRENEFNSPYLDAPMVTSSHTLSVGSNLLDKVFGKPWKTECEIIRQQSPYRDVKGWRLASFIIKAGEDIRKEALVMQIVSKLWTWFQAEIPPHLRPFLRPYTIMCVGGDAGLVECLPDVKSVNEVKKETDGFTSLLDFFQRAFRPVHPSIIPSADTVSFEKARDNFLRSLVGYSVVCYILQIKDRHNANILMDREGHIMHIDFGFVLGETPKMGKVPLFSERAPFKLSAEFWEVIGGWSAFKRFCEMFEAAYAVAAAHSDEICSLVEAAIVNVSRNSDQARSIADSVRRRMEMKADPKEQKMHVMNIVTDAITSWGTSTYDWLQRSMNGYQ
ncbi:hypothetical protein ACHAWX_005732 [Stephanocyclus meneghinianus]